MLSAAMRAVNVECRYEGLSMLSAPMRAVNVECRYEGCQC